jgi:hypothetical protein
MPSLHRTLASALRRGVPLVALLAVLPFAQTQASTIATFEWVRDPGTGTSTESGTLALTLPGTITTDQFTVSGATLSQITTFNYTYSNGTTANLSNMTTASFTAPGQWQTVTETAAYMGGSGVGETDLVTGYSITGTPSTFSLTNTAGGSAGIGLAVNALGTASDDGYWQLQSLTPVPLPAALPLLLSGLGAFGVGFRRRSRHTSA